MSDAPRSIVHQYSGSGVLEFSDGTDSRCQFIARQYSTGDVTLECVHEDEGADRIVTDSHSSASRFRGQTEMRRPIVIEAPFLTMEVEIGSSRTKTRHLCQLVELTLADCWSQDAVMTFDVTNVFFATDERRSPLVGDGNDGVIVLVVAGRELVLRNAVNQESRREYLRENGGVAVTAAIEVRVTSRDDAEDATRVVDRVCALLSLSRGTLVTWISYEIVGVSGSYIAGCSRSAKTKDYCASTLIDSERRGETRNFVQSVYDRYTQVETSFEMLRVIHARLDVNDGAFLETRGLVGSALVEYLATAYAREFGSADQLSGSLVDKLLFVSGDLRAGFSSTEVRSIARTRNHLAHRLRFATEDPPAEHSVLKHFLDVLILRLIGYSGPYVDCRTWQRRVLE